MYTIKFVLACGMLGTAFTSIFITFARMTLLMSAPTHKQHSNVLGMHQPRTDHFYTNKTPVSSHDTILYAIVTPGIVQDNVNTGSERST